MIAVVLAPADIAVVEVDIVVDIGFVVETVAGIAEVEVGTPVVGVVAAGLVAIPVLKKFLLELKTNNQL